MPPEALLKKLEDRGIPYTLYRHQPVFTVAESQSIDRDIPGAHVRNMFIRDKKEVMFLVTLRHETMIDLKKLPDVINCGRISFGSPDRLWKYLGIRPGSVNPFCILCDTEKQVTLILEKAMMEEDIINVHPMDNSMTVGIKPADLLRLLDDHGVKPIIIDLSAAAPDA